MRVLQVGFGNIGREVFRDWAPSFETYMVTDLIQPVPDGHEWDGEAVDVVVILVDTPKWQINGGDGFNYAALSRAIEEYQALADFILVRSTVSLQFLDTEVYREHGDRIGFSPEFYGATKWSSREALTIPFTLLTENVPMKFARRLAWTGIMRGNTREVIVAKLAENAYLAVKVTFFHELALACGRLGIDFESVRAITTSDPRIGPAHSFMEEPGWQSHCFDKDVPAFGSLARDLTLVRAAVDANKTLLSRREATP